MYEFGYHPSFNSDMKPKTVVGDHGDELFSVFGAPLLKGDGAAHLGSGGRGPRLGSWPWESCSFPPGLSFPNAPEWAEPQRSHLSLAPTCVMEHVHVCALIPGHSKTPDLGVSKTVPCSRAGRSPVASHPQDGSRMSVNLEPGSLVCPPSRLSVI